LLRCARNDMTAYVLIESISEFGYMTVTVIPAKAGIQEYWIPDQVRDDKAGTGEMEPSLRGAVRRRGNLSLIRIMESFYLRS
jgi:hypothetical protein